MTKFEQFGVNAQMDATTVEEARQSFNWSCRCCCSRGMHLDCERCAIRATHYNTIALIRDMESQSSGRTRLPESYINKKHNKQ